LTALGYGRWNGSQWSIPVDVEAQVSFDVGIDPINGDMYLCRVPQLHISGSVVQNYGLLGSTGGAYHYIKILSDGSVISHDNIYMTAALGLGKTDLPEEYTKNERIVIRGLANGSDTYLFRCHSLNQDATLEKAVDAGEVIEIYISPLQASSNFIGSILGLFNPGSYLNIPEYGVRDISMLIKEDMEVFNDGATQIINFNMFTGLSLTNTTAGTLYITIVDDGAGNFHADFYSDAARLLLVGHTASVAGIGPSDQVEDVIEDNASGMGGMIAFTNLSAADADIYAVVGVLDVYFQYNRYYRSVYEARY